MPADPNRLRFYADENILGLGKALEAQEGPCAVGVRRGNVAGSIRCGAGADMSYSRAYD